MFNKISFFIVLTLHTGAVAANFEIEEILEKLNRKIYDSVHELNIDDPRKKLAWLYAGKAIIGAINDMMQSAVDRAVSNNTSMAADNTSWSIASKALDASLRDLQSAGYNAARDATLKIIVPVLWPLLFEAAAKQASIDATLTRIGTEREALYWLLGNSESVVDQIYTGTEKALKDNPANNPFNSHEALMNFLSIHFGDTIAREAMFFIIPWLAHISDIGKFPAAHQALFIKNQNIFKESVAIFLAGHATEKNYGALSIIVTLPKELVYWILLIFVHVNHLVEPGSKSSCQ